MPESFLHLKAQEQSQIYRALAPQLVRSPVVLEKDVWVCRVLQALFTMPDRLPMAFKGGLRRHRRSSASAGSKDQ